MAQTRRARLPETEMTNLVSANNRSLVRDKRTLTHISVHLSYRCPTEFCLNTIFTRMLSGGEVPVKLFASSWVSVLPEGRSVDVTGEADGKLPSGWVTPSACRLVLGDGGDARGTLGALSQQEKWVTHSVCLYCIYACARVILFLWKQENF